MGGGGLELELSGLVLIEVVSCELFGQFQSQKTTASRAYMYMQDP